MEKEVKHGLDLLDTNIIDLLVYECVEVIKQVGETKLEINSYIEKIENRSKKLAMSIRDTDETSITTLIDEDSILSEKALETYYKLQAFEGRLKDIKEEESKTLKGELTSPHPIITEKMHKMFEFR